MVCKSLFPYVPMCVLSVLHPVPAQVFTPLSNCCCKHPATAAGTLDTLYMLNHANDCILRFTNISVAVLAW